MAATTRGIKVEGGPQLRRALKRLGAGANDLKDVHQDVGELVADTARGLVPVESGALKETIRESRAQASASVRAGRRAVPYAGPIHFGWKARNIEPQPFLYDALDDRRDDVVRRYREGIEDLVRRFDREAPDERV